MTPKLATAISLVGLGIATAGLLQLLNESGLVSGAPDLTSLATWVGVFLVGIFLFGLGLGKRTSGRY